MDKYFEEKMEIAVNSYLTTNYQPVGTTMRERTLGINSFKDGYKIGNDDVISEIDKYVKLVEEKEKDYQNSLDELKTKYDELIELQKKQYEESLEKQKSDYDNELEEEKNILIKNDNKELLELCKNYIIPSPITWGFTQKSKAELLEKIEIALKK
jgi:hypothetical protein